MLTRLSYSRTGRLSSVALIPSCLCDARSISIFGALSHIPTWKWPSAHRTPCNAAALAGRAAAHTERSETIRGRYCWAACFLSDRPPPTRSPHAAPLPVRRVGADETEQILRTGGRHLVDEYWGRYVAFMHDGFSHRTSVLRDPLGTMPGFAMHHQHVRVLYFVDARRSGPWNSAAFDQLAIHTRATGLTRFGMPRDRTAGRVAGPRRRMHRCLRKRVDERDTLESSEIRSIRYDSRPPRIGGRASRHCSTLCSSMGDTVRRNTGALVGRPRLVHRRKLSCRRRHHRENHFLHILLPRLEYGRTRVWSPDGGQSGSPTR